MKQQAKGITLISLVITIVVLLILSAVVISINLGEKGIINRAKRGETKYNEAQLKEELEIQISSLIMDFKIQGKATSINDIANNLDQIGEVLEVNDDMIKGEYKNYGFIVDKDRNVKITGKLIGVKPTLEITILTQGTGVEKVELQVVANTNEGEIKSLEPINGAILKTQNSISDKIYEVTTNGTYKFKVIGTNGRVTIAKKEVSNIAATMEAESILEGLSRIQTSGLVKMRVKGRKDATEDEETIVYSLNVINKEGDMTLNAEENDEQIENLKMEGITVDKENKTYSFGKTGDIGTKNEYAQNTVVLKVNGNLTINKDVIVTAIGSNYGGPKGLIIYCTGILTNNGEITMTGRGAKAEGENVYLYKNKSNNYEYIPEIGALGGKRQEYKQNNKWKYRRIRK